MEIINSERGINYKQIDDIESELGYELPSDYRDFFANIMEVNLHQTDYILKLI
jgi:cation transport regulator ChaB